MCDIIQGYRRSFPFALERLFLSDSPREKTKGSQLWAGFGVPQAELEEGTLNTEV